MSLARIENKLTVLSEQVGIPAYDFDFDLHFTCSHPYKIEHEQLCVLRIGAITDYAERFNEQLKLGLRLVNSPREYRLASELENWYPIISDLTPRSVVFDQLPSAAEIETHFQWPVFFKGSRQTSKHNPLFSVIENPVQYEQVASQYNEDSILRWQKPVVREFVPLAPIPEHLPGKIRPSVEFRSFWWFGECVGWGRYWYQVAPYDAPDAPAGLAIAREAASRMQVPFLVVDIAKTAEGRWVVIECNEAQESGYAAIPPYELWRQILLRITNKA